MFVDAHSTLVQNRNFIDLNIIQYIVCRKTLHARHHCGIKTRDLFHFF